MNEMLQTALGEKEPIRLLLVENDPGDAILVEEALSSSNNKQYKVCVEKSLQSAKARLRKTGFHVVLTDLSLPDSEGLSTLDAILEMDKGIPVIVLTGQDEDETGIRSLQKGAQDFLVKGDFNPKQLGRSIRYAIGRKEAEEELRASETRMRVLFENGPDAYVIMDPEGTIHDANHIAEVLTGLKKSEMVGKKCSRLGLISKDQLPNIEKALAHVSLGMSVGPDEYKMTGKNGRESFVEIKFIPLQIKGEVLIFTSFTDITERKLHAEKEQQYYKNIQQIYSSTLEMIQLSGVNQIVQFICDKIYSFLGDKGVVTFSSINEECDRFQVEYLKSHLQTLQFIESIIKKDLNMLTGAINPAHRDRLLEDKLIMLDLEEQLSEFSGGALSKQSSRLIKEGTKLRKIYSLGVKQSRKILGHVSIYTYHELDPTSIQLIESFVAQAGIVLERMNYQAALHESEAIYKILFEDSPLAIGVIGSDDRFKAWNKLFPQIFGVPEEEIPDIHIPDFYKDINDRERLYENLNRDGMIQNHELDLVKRNGEELIAEISIKHIIYRGEPSRMIVISDSTSKKQAERERKKLNQAIEQSPSMIMITDAKGYIEYVNPSFCKIIGFSREEVLGNKPAMLRPASTPINVYREMWTTLASGKEWSGRFQNKKKNGEIFWADAYMSPVYDDSGKLTNYVGIMVDVTLQKNAEEDLVRAKIHAEESDGLKSAFLNNISHEIRTPMNAILGFSELLSRREHSEEKKQEFITIIQNRSRDLMHIINGLVDISKIESGQMAANVSEVTVRSLLSDLSKEIKVADRPGVEFRLHMPEAGEDLKVHTDPIHVRRILSNLVNNAWKFTKQGQVEVGCNIQDGECVFFVHDTGIGIDPGKVDLIFDRFRQADKYDPDARGGNGLGLAIAKELSEIIDGRLWLESEKGRGTSFYFSIPMGEHKKEEEKNEKGYTRKSEMDFRDRVILVAEDDISSYLVMKNILESNGAIVKHVTNGLLAVEAFKSQEQTDLILMDMRMPLMDGFDATKVIRNLDPEIPVFALSASRNKEFRERCIKSGCNEFLSKPIVFGELINTIGKYLVTVSQNQ